MTRVATQTMTSSGPSGHDLSRIDPDLSLRHYAEWWMWAREALIGPAPRLQAAARAGMTAQSAGASVASAMAAARQAFRDGPNDSRPVDDVAQHYAELYVRAHLALGLGLDNAHKQAAAALSKWNANPTADIRTLLRARTSVRALFAAAFAGAGAICLGILWLAARAAFGEPVADSALQGLSEGLVLNPLAAIAPLALGILSFCVGGSAGEHIKHTGKRGAPLATASQCAGCVIALAATLTGGLLVLELARGAFCVCY